MTIEATEVKENLLLKMATDNYSNSLTQVAQQRLRLDKAKELSGILPPSILAFRWWTLHPTIDNNHWYLESGVMDEEQANELIKELKIFGVQGFHWQYVNHSDRWQYEGKFTLNDCTYTIKVDGGSKPPSCRIEETTEFKEVTIRKAFCETTGEEL